MRYFKEMDSLHKRRVDEIDRHTQERVDEVKKSCSAQNRYLLLQLSVWVCAFGLILFFGG